MQAIQILLGGCSSRYAREISTDTNGIRNRSGTCLDETIFESGIEINIYRFRLRALLFPTNALTHWVASTKRWACTNAQVTKFIRRDLNISCWDIIVTSNIIPTRPIVWIRKADVSSFMLVTTNKAHSISIMISTASK